MKAPFDSDNVIYTDPWKKNDELRAEIAKLEQWLGTRGKALELAHEQAESYRREVAEYRAAINTALDDAAQLRRWLAATHEALRLAHKQIAELRQENEWLAARQGHAKKGDGHGE